LTTARLRLIEAALSGRTVRHMIDIAEALHEGLLGLEAALCGSSGRS
jgi:hypothetical protein